jgi:hypothetical protein
MKGEHKTGEIFCLSVVSMAYMTLVGLAAGHFGARNFMAVNFVRKDKCLK